MTTFPISEDLRGVLEDVAAQPKHRLFAASGFRQTFEAFDHGEDVVRPSLTGLSTAERHLLRVHRDELALGLLHGFYNHFLAPGGPGEKLNLTGTRAPDDEWKTRASYARDNARPAAFEKGVATWLHRLLRDRPPATVHEYFDLAVTTARLTRAERAAIDSGMCLMATNSFAAANGILERLATPRESNALSLSLSLQGACAFRMGDFKKSLRLEVESMSASGVALGTRAQIQRLSRALIYERAPRLAGNPLRDTLLRSAAPHSKELSDSLARFAEMNPEVPFWQQITCEILDDLELVA